MNTALLNQLLGDVQFAPVGQMNQLMPASAMQPVLPPYLGAEPGHVPESAWVEAIKRLVRPQADQYMQGLPRYQNTDPSLTLAPGQMRIPGYYRSI